MKVEFYVRGQGDGQDWHMACWELRADGWRDELAQHIRQELGNVELPEFPPIGVGADESP